MAGIQYKPIQKPQAIQNKPIQKPQAIQNKPIQNRPIQSKPQAIQNKPIQSKPQAIQNKPKETENVQEVQETEKPKREPRPQREPNDATEKQMIEDIKKAEEALSRKRKSLRNKRAKDKRAAIRKQIEDLGKEFAELLGYKMRLLTEEERQEIIDQIKELAEKMRQESDARKHDEK